MTKTTLDRAGLEAAKNALNDAAEELRLIRMKDSPAVYDTLLRHLTIPLAIQKIDAALASLGSASSGPVRWEFWSRTSRWFACLDEEDARIWEKEGRKIRALYARPAPASVTEGINVDAAARYLRETSQAGKNLTPWELTPNATKKKWLALAAGLVAALAKEG